MIRSRIEKLERAVCAIRQSHVSAPVTQTFREWVAEHGEGFAQHYRQNVQIVSLQEPEERIASLRAILDGLKALEIT